MSSSRSRAARRRELLALQREEPSVRGVELHLLASGDLFLASGRGVPAGLLARFTGLPWSPAEARLEPAEVAAALEALQQIPRQRLAAATRAALDRIAA